MLKVTITGERGEGKTMVAMLIADALRAAGLQVEHLDDWEAVAYKHAATPPGVESLARAVFGWAQQQMKRGPVQPRQVQIESALVAPAAQGNVYVDLPHPAVVMASKAIEKERLVEAHEWTTTDDQVWTNSKGERRYAPPGKKVIMTKSLWEACKALPDFVSIMKRKGLTEDEVHVIADIGPLGIAAHRPAQPL